MRLRVNCCVRDIPDLLLTFVFSWFESNWNLVCFCLNLERLCDCRNNVFNLAGNHVCTHQSLSDYQSWSIDPYSSYSSGFELCFGWIYFDFPVCRRFVFPIPTLNIGIAPPSSVWHIRLVCFLFREPQGGGRHWDLVGSSFHRDYLLVEGGLFDCTGRNDDVTQPAFRLLSIRNRRGEGQSKLLLISFEGFSLYTRR